jgi:hypothetical protein
VKLKHFKRYCYIFLLLLITANNAHATDPGACFKMYAANGNESYQYQLGEYINFDASCTSSNLKDDHRAWFVPPFTGVTDPENWAGFPGTPCYVGVANLGTDSDPHYIYFHNTTECPFLTDAKSYSTSYYKEGTYVMRLDMTDENYQHNGPVPSQSNYTMSKQFTVGRPGSSTCMQDGNTYCAPDTNIAWLVPVVSLLLN